MTMQQHDWICPPRRVLVGTDFGDAAAGALAVGAIVASAYDATLRVVHAERFEPPAYFTIDQIGRLEAERRAAQSAAEAHVRGLAAGITAYPIEAAVVDESPVDAILHASESADLVVLGTHGRHGPGRWWLGSVAERVVRAAQVPVLVVRADVQARDVFDRILVAGSGSAAHDCAARLAATFGSTVGEAGSPHQCDERTLREASLVIVSAGADDVVAAGAAGLLSVCRRPILFVPDRQTNSGRNV
ncbi:MAG TPA: universal stress protein [Vicinamibacterales bacterium]